MEKEAIISLRLERQHLINKIDNRKDYEKLFKYMQPVAPIFFSAPGEAPSLVHRTIFDDKMHNENLRSRRKIVKGRFQGGNVGYVYLEELELYIAAYRKNIPHLNFKEEIIYDLLQNEGPLNIHQIKEITGLLAKEITPVLLKLSKAFYIYEDQVDSSWERGWYILERELSVDINKYRVDEAVKEIIKRALYLLVFVNSKELQSWLRLPVKIIKTGLDSLIDSGIVMKIKEDDNEGYLLRTDYDYLVMMKPKIGKSVFVLHKSDILVKAFELKLKEQFIGHEILQYILIDGEFQGAVCGHWRIGPHDVSDIVLTILKSERNARKKEIIEAVKKIYEPPFSNILKYDGKEIKNA